MFLHTRREFVNLLALSGAGLLSVINRLAAAEAPIGQGKPNSRVAGVQLGLNVPYSFANGSMSGAILKNCLQLGISAVELRTQPVEAFLGVSADLINPKKSDAASASANAERLRQ